MANINDFLGKTGNATKDADAYRIQKGSDLTSEEALQFVNKYGSGKSNYNSSTTSSSSIGNLFDDKTNESFGSKLNGVLNQFTSALAGGVNGVIKTQLGAEEKQNAPQALLNTFKDGAFDPIGLIKNGGTEVISALNEELTNESKLFTEINSKTGLNGELSKGLQKDMIQASVEASRYGISINEIGEFYTQMSANSGKFALINRDIMESAPPVATILGKTMSEMGDIISQYETVGLGVDKTIKALGDAALRTVGLGLNARTVSKQMSEQIDNLNKFGFQNGIQGLERMAQKAVEFKMSMDQVFKLADNVFTPEKAIEMSASLQVLGGAMGAFNDPIKLMYMATNNVEGLQDALQGATQGLATYNQEQGKFEITGVNLRKAREMANALGVDYKELTKSAIAGAERMSATTALMANTVTSSMSDKDKEFLINMSRMEGGEMKIVVPESLSESFGNVQEIAMDKLTSSQSDALLKYQKEMEKTSTKELAMSQLTATQQMVRDLDVMATYARVQGAQALRGVGSALLQGDAMTSMKDLLVKYSNLKDKSIYGTEKKASQVVTGAANALGELPSKAADYIVDKYNKVMGNNPTPKETTQNVNMVITHKSEGSITDTVFSAVRKDPTAMSNFATFSSPKDLTYSNIAHKK